MSDLLLSRLVKAPHNLELPKWSCQQSALTDEDLQLSLYVLYGLHYDGFDGVDDRWEWEPSLVSARTWLEQRMLDELIQRVGPVESSERDPRAALDRIIGSGGSRSLSGFVESEAELDQLREFLVHRSIYQRKEADAHTFAIPRLRGIAKSAMVRIQTDEYGEGLPGRSHAELFATTMTALGLDATPGAYIDEVPAVTLATDNLVSLFSLHRARRAELVGHLAVFEMTSVVPMGRYAAGIRRLTGSDDIAEFYDVHVEADEVHAKLAANDLVGGFVAAEPASLPRVLFGAAALMHVEADFTDHLLDRWTRGMSSLHDASQRYSHGWSWLSGVGEATGSSRSMTGSDTRSSRTTQRFRPSRFAV